MNYILDVKIFDDFINKFSDPKVLGGNHILQSKFFSLREQWFDMDVGELLR